MAMTQNELNIYNDIQEVLRGLMSAIIAAQPSLDKAKLAIALQSASTHPNISPFAQTMLLNLAELPDFLSKSQNQQH